MTAKLARYLSLFISIHSYIPSKYAKKHYVVLINNVEPITAAGTKLNISQDWKQWHRQWNRQTAKARDIQSRQPAASSSGGTNRLTNGSVHHVYIAEQWYLHFLNAKIFGVL